MRAPVLSKFVLRRVLLSSSLTLSLSIQVDMSGKFLSIMQHLMHFVPKSPSLSPVDAFAPWAWAAGER